MQAISQKIIISNAADFLDVGWWLLDDSRYQKLKANSQSAEQNYPEYKYATLPVPFTGTMMPEDQLPVP